MLGRLLAGEGGFGIPKNGINRNPRSCLTAMAWLFSILQHNTKQDPSEPAMIQAEKVGAKPAEQHLLTATTALVRSRVLCDFGRSLASVKLRSVPIWVLEP